MKRPVCRGNEPTYERERTSSRIVLPKLSRIALICFMSASGGRSCGGAFRWKIQPRDAPFFFLHVAVQADEAVPKSDAFLPRIFFRTEQGAKVKFASFRGATHRDGVPEEGMASVSRSGLVVTIDRRERSPHLANF